MPTPKLDTINQRHGSPYDRGKADAWYSRSKNPHYYVGHTGHTDPIRPPVMTSVTRTDKFKLRDTVNPTYLRGQPVTIVKVNRTRVKVRLADNATYQGRFTGVFSCPMSLLEKVNA